MRFKKENVTMKKMMTTLFVLLGMVSLVACGDGDLDLSDLSSMQGALEESNQSDDSVVSPDCMDECVAKGESEEDCVQWCSDPSDADKETWCMDECVAKGESEEDCSAWCSDFGKDDCDEKEDWDDKEYLDDEEK